MKAKINSHNGEQKFPQTRIHSLLNDNLIICIRLWSGPEVEQKAVDEIARYLSAADADLEVTTPFDYIESISSLANKVRVALLLANEAIYLDNKEKYSQGFEVAICYKHSKEVSIGSVGRFAFNAEKKDKSFTMFESGAFLDDLVLLPTDLLGVEREVDIKCSSVSTRDLTSIQIDSTFDQNTYWQAQINQFD
ncbi:hypothetical protein CIK05_02470 [Bdellovibrio sp. qaytius]|nr:hypothetical protein CIK05_02470 [Bdellovibrio sp. qaytius]